MYALKPGILIDWKLAAGVLVVHGWKVMPVVFIVLANAVRVLDHFGLWELFRIPQNLAENCVHVDFPEVGIAVFG